MSKKIKKIVIFSILAILGIVYTVFYILYPKQTLETTTLIIDYICNKPLPVIGITILFLAIMVKSIIKITGIGNKTLRECRSNLQESKEAQEKTHEELLAFEEHFEDKFKEFMSNHSKQMREICAHIPNKNVKELGEKFYGEEKNSESVEE